MLLSPSGLEMIKRFEGLRLTAYQCEAGRWTVGYGHTEDVHEGATITAHQADVMLEVDVSHFEAAVEGLLEVPVNQHQFDALVSFAFNLGAAALGRSSLLKKLNACDFAGAADEFGKWVYAGGRVSPGLVKRRAAERELFLKPEPTNEQVP